MPGPGIATTQPAVVMENRNGLVVAAKATLATGTAEREAARETMAGLARGAWSTRGADKNYDTRECVPNCAAWV